jgi:hypothetical protein
VVDVVLSVAATVGCVVFTGAVVDTVGKGATVAVGHSPEVGAFGATK